MKTLQHPKIRHERSPLEKMALINYIRSQEDYKDVYLLKINDSKHEKYEIKHFIIGNTPEQKKHYEKVEDIYAETAECALNFLKNQRLNKKKIIIFQEKEKNNPDETIFQDLLKRSIKDIIYNKREELIQKGTDTNQIWYHFLDSKYFPLKKKDHSYSNSINKSSSQPSSNNHYIQPKYKAA